MATLLDRQNTSRQLRDVAQDKALAARAEELHALADALADPDDSLLDPWADLDLVANFGRPECMTHDLPAAPGERVAATLDWLLGALVFLPLLFTWIGLWRASSAYQSLIDTDPQAADRPFPQLWQTGFEGQLSGMLWFGHVAVLGCVALLALLGLTLFHGWRRATVERAEEAAGRRTRAVVARLVPLLTRAQLVLNQHRFASPQRFAEELNRAGGRVQRMQTNAIAAQEELTRAAKTVADVLQQAEERLNRADAGILPLEQAVGKLEAGVRDSGTTIRAAVDSLTTPLAKAGEDLRAATEQLRDVLSGTADRLESTVTGNNGEVRTAVTEAASRVEDAMTELVAAQRGFTTGMEIVADLNGRLIAGVTGLASQHGRVNGDSSAGLEKAS